MSVDRIISVDVSRETQSIAVASFSLPCIVSEFEEADTTVPFTRIRSYASLTEMTTDGWTTSDDEYKKAAAFFRQNPTVEKVYIGRKDPIDDASWADALDAISIEDNSWYGLIAIPDGTFATDIKAIAAWAETAGKMFFVQTTETATLTSGTTDLAYDLKALGYDRTATLYHLAANEGEALEASSMGEGFPFAPGSSTYDYKTLTGVTADNMTSSQKAYAFGKNCATYTVVGGVSITEGAVVASGEYVDTIINIDWLTARIQEAIFANLVNVRKIPYDDNGISIIGGLLEGVLSEAERKGVLIPGSSSVSLPLYADISTANKTARNLPDVTFTALIQGAIHTVQVSGTVTV